MKFTVYLTTLIPFVFIDGMWLFLTGKTVYAKHLGHLMNTSPSWPPAILFYLIFIAGMVFFVVSPALEKNASMVSTFLTGAFFGLVTYATYDLTNQATLNNWPIFITVIDLIWGALLTGTVSCVAINLTKWGR